MGKETPEPSGKRHQFDKSSPIADAERRAARQSEEFEGVEISPSLEPAHHTTDHPAVETPVEARQGFLGRPVLAVLLVGLLLIALAWLFVGLLVY